MQADRRNCRLQTQMQQVQESQMSWLIEQEAMQNIEDYQSYRISKELEGKRTPSLEEVIKLIKRKGWNNEKVQNQKR